MPKVKVNDININYDRQGSGEPIVLIPYLAADHACYAFQVAEYSKHFTCVSLDPRGAGESDKPDGAYTTELFADDVAAFMDAIGVDRAHIFGLSLATGVGLWLAAKYPEKVKSLSLHGAWTKTDPFLETVVGSWRILANSLGSVHEMAIQGIFPWCLTPDLYAKRPDYIQSLAAFVRSRPEQPIDAFMRQTQAVLDHDVEGHIHKIKAPTQVTLGEHDMITSKRHADRIAAAIPGTEVTVFEGCSHAPLYEKVEEFNRVTLDFLKRHSGEQISVRSTGSIL
jgi:pimeloyl-ACP methyl ester carboxylesterase